MGCGSQRFESKGGPKGSCDGPPGAGIIEFAVEHRPRRVGASAPMIVLFHFFGKVMAADYHFLFQIQPVRVEPMDSGIQMDFGASFFLSRLK
jgi:hypothetical protein